MVPPRSRSLRRRPSLLHPFFRRAPLGGIAGLRNPVSRDPVRERGDQVFGERTRATAGSDDFPNDDFFPDVGNLFISDMGDNGANANANGSAPTAPYVIRCLLFEIMLHVLFVVFMLDMICLSTVLVDRMASLIFIMIALDCLPVSWIKSYAKLLIFSTIQKPDYRQFTASGFLASMKPPPFKGVHYKRWRTRAVYWFQSMQCYDATKGNPEGDLTPA